MDLTKDLLEKAHLISQHIEDFLRRYCDDHDYIFISWKFDYDYPIYENRAYRCVILEYKIDFGEDGEDEMDCVHLQIIRFEELIKAFNKAK